MGYVTSQRKALHDLLEQHRDEVLTAEQILSSLGESASRSAVFRNLSALEKRGLIKKSAATGSNKALYRYIGSKDCKDHLHLSCSKCGKTFHLEVPATNALIDYVLKDADFRVDSSSTVLYGVCQACRGN